MPRTPVNSTATFAVHSSFDAIAATGFKANPQGRDAAFRAVNLDNYNDCSGSPSLSKRTAIKSATPPGCTSSTILIDTRIFLNRSRDGLRIQDALTVGYDATHKPICALLPDGTF